MNLPPALQVFILASTFVMVALALGFRLKTKFRADDTIYDGIIADLKRVNGRVESLTAELAQERRDRHEESSALRIKLGAVTNELGEARIEIKRLGVLLGLVRDQVVKMGGTPVA